MKKFYFRKACLIGLLRRKNLRMITNRHGAWEIFPKRGVPWPKRHLLVSHITVDELVETGDLLITDYFPSGLPRKAISSFKVTAVLEKDDVRINA